MQQHRKTDKHYHITQTTLKGIIHPKLKILTSHCYLTFMSFQICIFLSEAKGRTFCLLHISKVHIRASTYCMWMRIRSKSSGREQQYKPGNFSNNNIVYFSINKSYMNCFYATFKWVINCLFILYYSLTFTYKVIKFLFFLDLEVLHLEVIAYFLSCFEPI